MITMYELEDEDIVKIIAKHFGCPDRNVFLRIEESYRGYGTAEEKTQAIVAEVRMPIEKIVKMENQQ